MHFYSMNLEFISIYLYTTTWHRHRYTYRGIRLYSYLACCAYTTRVYLSASTSSRRMMSSNGFYLIIIRTNAILFSITSTLSFFSLSLRVSQPRVLFKLPSGRSHVHEVCFLAAAFDPCALVRKPHRSILVGPIRWKIR